MRAKHHRLLRVLAAAEFRDDTMHRDGPRERRVEEQLDVDRTLRQLAPDEERILAPERTDWQRERDATNRWITCPQHLVRCLRVNERRERPGVPQASVERLVAT